MPPNAYPCPVSGQASPHGQQGWFLLPVVMLLFALSLGSYFALATTNARSSEARRASTDAVALEAARAALPEIKRKLSAIGVACTPAVSMH